MERTNLTTAATGQVETTQAPRMLPRTAGEVIDIGSTCVRFLVRSPETAGAFSLIEYPILPRTLVAPEHRHTREDEYSFVLAGRAAALLGDEVIYAEPGELIFKPRRQWHTIWNQATNHAGSSRRSPQEASSASSMSSLPRSSR